jgi:predicted MFS family arabinose efflux permease
MVPAARGRTTRVGSTLVRNPFASPLWRNQAFVRVWSAATVSIFGSLITRLALPLAAILVLGSGAVEIALLRSAELIATLVFGLVAGAWVDRLRRRPVLIWADLGRAVLLGSIPLAFIYGVLTFWQLLLVTGLASILTTFFDAADSAYLPTIVERERLVDANGALAASSSASEFTAFGVTGFLVQLLTAPIAIALDAVTFLVSAMLLATIRHDEPPPPPPAEREAVLAEIRDGLGLVRNEPVLRAFAGAQMSMAAHFGVGGATWFLFVLDDLKLGAPAIGLIAAVGGVSAFVGAIVGTRATRRWGIGRVAVGALLLAALGSAFVPLAPAGMPIIAIGCLVMAQIVGDSAVTVYDITEVSVRQTVVHDRALGRVSSTFNVAAVVAQLAATLLAGLLAEAIGLRATIWIGTLGGVVGAAILWASPVRHLIVLPTAGERDETIDPVAVAIAAEREKPPGA